MIRLLTSKDAQAYADLRREMLEVAPLAFASSPGDDRFASKPDAFRSQIGQSDDSVVFGAFVQALVGAVGLCRDPHRKASHKAHIWGMYVQREHRDKGLGSQLIGVAVEYAKSLPRVSWIHLSVSTDAPEAARLYQLAGFRSWGTEPEALIHDGRATSEVHMALQLH